MVDKERNVRGPLAQVSDMEWAVIIVATDLQPRWKVLAGGAVACCGKGGMR